MAVPELLAKDQRVEDYGILSALYGETAMAINVFGVLIWRGLAHCSPIRRAHAKLPIVLLRLSGTRSIEVWAYRKH